jgi:beta-glucosidase
MLSIQVTQVYMAWTEATVQVPRWTLVGFKRQRHTVNQPSVLKFVVTAEQMAVWVDDKTGFKVQPGENQPQMSSHIILIAMFLFCR